MAFLQNKEDDIEKMQVKLRCGEIYDFHRIKSIQDNGNGTVEIVGNFQPRGRYKHVVLFIMSIENWEEVMHVYPISQKPYWCSKCKRWHNKGDVYEEHKENYRRADDVIPDDRILKANIKKLRKVAKNQIGRLLKKLEMNPSRKSIYKREINKLLIYEGVVVEDIFS